MKSQLRMISPIMYEVGYMQPFYAQIHTHTLDFLE